MVDSLLRDADAQPKGSSMPDTVQTEGIRFGRTMVVAVAGVLTDQAVDVLVHAANCRGVMGTRGPGALRLAAGAAVEHEAMGHAPLDLGTALVTGPGDLAARGVQAIIHAVVHRTLGDPVRLSVLRRATAAVLQAADEQRLRSLALPPLGAGTDPDDLAPVAAAEVIVDEIVGYLRRSSTRLERIVLVGQLDIDAATFAGTVARARERVWVRPL